MTFLYVSVPQRSPYVSNTSELRCWDGPVPPWARVLSVTCSQGRNELCYFMLLVHYGVLVAFRPENVSLFWSYLMDIFPVLDVVKVVLLFFGTPFPRYLSEYFCDTCGVFLCLVLRVYSEHSLYVLPWLSLRGEVFPVTCAGPDHTDSNACLCEGHSDWGHGLPLKLFVKTLMI